MSTQISLFQSFPTQNTLFRSIQMYRTEFYKVPLISLFHFLQSIIYNLVLLTSFWRPSAFHINNQFSLQCPMISCCGYCNYLFHTAAQICFFLEYHISPILSMRSFNGWHLALNLILMFLPWRKINHILPPCSLFSRNYFYFYAASCKFILTLAFLP